MPSLVENLQHNVIEIQKVNLANAIEVNVILTKTEEVFKKLSKLYHVEKDEVTGQYHSYIGGIK